jgi:hypothetical protein
MKRLSILLTVLVAACGTPTAPSHVPVQIVAENTSSSDTLLAWWWLPDGSFDYVKLAPMAGRGPCIEYDATWLRLAAWQGPTDLTGNYTSLEHPNARGKQFWFIRSGGSGGPPTISARTAAVC